MNYRHAYHAGNFADVFKHAVLALIIEHLRRKEGAFAVIDTHAGIGRYDLAAEQANKTEEYKAGIARLIGVPTPPELAGYLGAVGALNPGAADLRWYPGSPRIARFMLRPQDRLELVELHPQDVQTLKREFARDPQVHVHHMDAYAALKAFLPPKERRGLVLIDPPFEVRDEFDRILHGLGQALRRWATGTYAVWYPVKGREPVDRFHDGLARLAPKCLIAELMIHPGNDPARLNGNGLAIINPPWQLDETLGRLMPGLLRLLDRPEGSARIDWLVPE